MMLVYPPAGLTIHMKKDMVQTIVIEEPRLFYEITNDIYGQINGNSGDTVISENYVPVQLGKSVDIITQFIPFTLNRKDIIGGIYSEMKEKSVNAFFYDKTHELYAHIEKYLYELIEDENTEMDFYRPSDISAILKAFDLHIAETDKSLNERLFEYMLAMREYKNKTIFITAGLRNYITAREAGDLFESVLLNGITLICLESKAPLLLKKETRVIIDEDFCII